MQDSALQRLMRPRSVAMVGATPRENTAANRVLRNLQRFGFQGPIYPINPRYEEVLGLKCHASLRELPEKPDAVFIALAADQAVGVLEEVAACGITSVLVNAAGFADGGPEGEERQRQLTRVAKSAGMALAGPNNMGFVNVHDRICLYTPRQLPPIEPGPIAAITQSGSLSLILTEHERRLGFAYVITAGNEAVCTAADYLNFAIRDERVRVVVLFLEAIRNPQLFAEAALEAARLGKRIVVLKVGRTARGSAAVAGHTGAVTGDDDLYNAFFRRYGIIRANDIDELVETAILVSSHPSPPKNRKVIAITCSGGEAGLIADIGTQAGVQFSEFGKTTLEGLRPSLPVFASPRNPFDVWGLGWNIDRFKGMLGALAADPDAGVLACSIDAPFAGGVDVAGSREMANACAEILPRTDKKIVFFNNASGRLNPDVEQILGNAGIPYLSGMRAALASIALWTRLELPAGSARDQIVPCKHLPDPRSLSDPAKTSLLEKAGIGMAPCIGVASATEAVAAARRLGYPVVLKGTAPDLPHKTEHGLVRLNLAEDAAVTRAYDELAPILAAHSKAGALATIVVQPMLPQGTQLLLGLRNDSAFGSAVVVGLGGTYVEISREVSLRIGPVDEAEALDMLRETRAGALLAGTRGQGPFDIEAAAAAIAALSRFGVEAREAFVTIEINPLIVLSRGKGAFGVDVVIEAFGA